MYTDAFIAELIACPKKMVGTIKDVSNRAAYTKKEFSMQSVDGKHEFTGFITWSQFFEENFSIGLKHEPKEIKGDTVLLRCNGKHGGTKKQPHHAYCHIHYATEARIEQGLKEEGLIEACDEYSTYETAIQFYIRKVNIVPADRQKHFPPPSEQIRIFDESSDQNGQYPE